MVNPTHPGESIRNCIDESDWTVTECAARLGISRNNLSRFLNGRIGISARVALGLEAVGWSNAEFWMHLQANYDLVCGSRKALSMNTLTAQRLNGPGTA